MGGVGGGGVGNRRNCELFLGSSSNILLSSLLLFFVLAHMHTVCVCVCNCVRPLG